MSNYYLNNRVWSNICCTLSQYSRDNNYTLVILMEGIKMINVSYITSIQKQMLALPTSSQGQSYIILPSVQCEPQRLFLHGEGSYLVSTGWNSQWCETFKGERSEILHHLITHFIRVMTVHQYLFLISVWMSWLSKERFTSGRPIRTNYKFFMPQRDLKYDILQWMQIPLKARKCHTLE